ncbi:histidine phosphatase family protein [Kutzneria sp. NPDC051319]|uniref:histidine phosphatase family protein n=1 Tax=Kutzneria sp. NPDC051319 TaxID=3155047 RepID=UPI00342D4DDB
MTTFVIRHGRTALSATYQVNGDPAAAVPLDEVGVRQCAVHRGALWLQGIAVTVTSRFPRTKQTAGLLLGGAEPNVVDPRLDEIDYGHFEGGPWLRYGAWLREHGLAAVPPGGSESWYQATERLLVGLAICLDLPGPRLVVGHGLLVSLLLALRCNDGPPDGAALPEAPYVSPLRLTDVELRELVQRGARAGG